MRLRGWRFLFRNERCLQHCQIWARIKPPVRMTLPWLFGCLLGRSKDRNHGFFSGNSMKGTDLLNL